MSSEGTSRSWTSVAARTLLVALAVAWYYSAFVKKLLIAQWLFVPLGVAAAVVSALGFFGARAEKTPASFLIVSAFGFALMSIALALHLTQQESLGYWIGVVGILAVCFAGLWWLKAERQARRVPRGE